MKIIHLFLFLFLSALELLAAATPEKAGVGDKVIPTYIRPLFVGFTEATSEKIFEISEKPFDWGDEDMLNNILRMHPENRKTVIEVSPPPSLAHIIVVLGACHVLKSELRQKFDLAPTWTIKQPMFVDIRRTIGVIRKKADPLTILKNVPPSKEVVEALLADPSWESARLELGELPKWLIDLDALTDRNKHELYHVVLTRFYALKFARDLIVDKKIFNSPSTVGLKEINDSAFIHDASLIAFDTAYERLYKDYLECNHPIMNASFFELRVLVHDEIVLDPVYRFPYLATKLKHSLTVEERLSTMTELADCSHILLQLASLNITMASAFDKFLKCLDCVIDETVFPLYKEFLLKERNRQIALKIAERDAADKLAEEEERARAAIERFAREERNAERVARKKKEALLESEAARLAKEEANRLAREFEETPKTNKKGKMKKPPKPVVIKSNAVIAPESVSVATVFVSERPANGGAGAREDTVDDDGGTWFSVGAVKEKHVKAERKPVAKEMPSAKEKPLKQLGKVVATPELKAKDFPPLLAVNKKPQAKVVQSAKVSQSVTVVKDDKHVAPTDVLSSVFASPGTNKRVISFDPHAKPFEPMTLRFDADEIEPSSAETSLLSIEEETSSLSDVESDSPSLLDQIANTVMMSSDKVFKSISLPDVEPDFSPLDCLAKNMRMLPGGALPFTLIDPSMFDFAPIIMAIPMPGGSFVLGFQVNVMLSQWFINRAKDVLSTRLSEFGEPVLAPGRTVVVCQKDGDIQVFSGCYSIKNLGKRAWPLVISPAEMFLMAAERHMARGILKDMGVYWRVGEDAPFVAQNHEGDIILYNGCFDSRWVGIE